MKPDKYMLTFSVGEDYVFVSSSRTLNDLYLSTREFVSMNRHLCYYVFSVDKRGNVLNCKRKLSPFYREQKFYPVYYSEDTFYGLSYYKFFKLKSVEEFFGRYACGIGHTCLSITTTMDRGKGRVTNES